MKRICVIILFSMAFLMGKAQKSIVHYSEYDSYKKAMELFDKQKFSAAQRYFTKQIKETNNTQAEISVSAEYYAALCALELFNKDAEHLLTQFVKNHPESPDVRRAFFHLGRYNYRKHKWEKVIEWFDKVDMYDLTNDDVAEFHFKRGYAFFMMEKFDEASKALYEIKDVDTKFTAPARYYYSHIAYQQQNYQTALEGFKKLENHEKFKSVVPYYITQILYKQKKYDEVISYVPLLLDSVSPKRAPEINRLLGDSYYKKGMFKESVPYLEKYIKGNVPLTPQDKYQMGYAYYKTQKYDEAISYFNTINNSGDDLAQTAFYHLADCYLKIGNKKFAMNAFQSSFGLEFDQSIIEDAMFNYAQLAYELAFDPYNKAIDAFDKFLERFPDSDKADDARQYLLNIYMTTNNYQMALTSLEKMKRLDDKLQAAYQRIAYNMGVEEFHNNKNESAVSYFVLSRKYSIDKKMALLSYYWAGEAEYKDNNYKDAIKNFSDFIFQPGAILMTNYFNRCNYNIGYAYFKEEKFNDAVTYFRKFTGDKNEKDSVRLSDAHLRIADAYFLAKDYNGAEKHYQYAIDINKLDVDYALYQRAMAMGILKNRSNKTALLEQLLAQHKDSKYQVDAKYQLAREYMINSDYQKAIAFFEDIVSNYPNSSYVRKSLLNIGLMHYNNDEYEKALTLLKRIVNDYPNYEDSREALVTLKNIYVKLGRAEEYADYMNSLTFVDISRASLDSVSYEAAEIQYLDGNCDVAVRDFEKYLEKYDPAIFGLNAHFYKGECLYKKQKFDDALEDYNYVINRPPNKFTESALVKASQLNYQNKRYQDALNNYMSLENIAEYKANTFDAQLGQMRCFYLLGNIASATEYADKVLSWDKVEGNIFSEAHFIKAEYFFGQNKLEEAYTEYTITEGSSKGEQGARAKYQMANIRFIQKQLDLSEKEVFELVNRVPNYGYWVAKGLVLLSEIYYSKGDFFQAKATLQSIIDNYKGDDDLIGLAQQKMDKISEEEENMKKRMIDEKPEEINFEDENLEDLIEEEEEVLEEF